MTPNQPTPLPSKLPLNEIARELAQSRVSFESLHTTVVSLEEQLQIIDGRTIRHEAGHDLIRELKSEIVQLEARLEEEVTLRRDLTAIVERSGSRDLELESELRRALEVITQRLNNYEEHQMAIDERQRSLASDVIERADASQLHESRFVNVESRVAAQRDATIEQAESIGGLLAKLPDLDRRIDALALDVEAARTARARMDEELASIRAIRDREAELLELLEQQRATRTRHETRLSEIEELVTLVRQELSEATEARERIIRDQMGGSERLRTIDERLEALRISIIEHLRRQVRADEQSGRRLVEETERELRTARTLLTQMSEQTEDVVKEQPL